MAKKVTVTIKAIDEASGTLTGIAQSSESMTRSFMKANIAMAGLSKAAGMLKGAMGAMKDAIVESATIASNFEYSLQKIANVAGIEGADNMEQLTTSIRALSEESGYSLNEMQNAFYTLGAAGAWTQEELEGIMEHTTTLAMATGTDLVQATETAAKVFNAYGLSVDDASGLMDVLTNAANESALELTDLTTALGYVGPTANAVGMDVAETSAMLGLLSNMGFEASMSGTALRSALLQMATPSRDAERTMRQLGVSFFDSSGNMRDMTDIIPELAAATATMSDQQKLTTTETLFGVRAGSAMLALMNAETDAFGNATGNLEIFTDKMYETGTAQEQAAALMDTTKIKVDQLKAVVSGIALDFGNAIIGSEGFQNALSMLQDILADPAITETLAVIGEVIGEVLIAVMPVLKDVMGALLPIIQQFAGFLKELIPIIQPLIGFIGTFLVKAFDKLGPVLEKLFPVLLELADAFVTAIMPALDELLPVLDMITPLFDAIIPIIEILIPIVEALAPVIKLLASIFANNLIFQIKSLIVVFNFLLPILKIIAFIFTALSPLVEMLSPGIELLAAMFQLLANPLVIVDVLLSAIFDTLDSVVKGLQTAGDAVLDFITFWDPPGPCLAEAVQAARYELEQFDDELGNLSHATMTVTPDMEGFRETFADVEGTAVGGIGGAGGGHTVNITIEGDVRDDETVNEIGRYTLSGLGVRGGLGII